MRNTLCQSALHSRLGVSKFTVVKWYRLGLPYQQRGRCSKKFIHMNDLVQFASQNPHLFGGIQRDRLALVFNDSELIDRCMKFPPIPHGCSKAVRCIETGQIFVSIAAAGIAHHISQASICRAIRDKGTCASYHWQYATWDEYLEQFQEAA